MACESVLDLLNRLTGMFDMNVLQQFWPTSPRLQLTRRGTWPDGIGTTISTQIYGRSAPVVAQPVWSPITVVAGAEGGACLPPATRVTPGYQVRQYSLGRMRLVGPDLCAEDLRFNWQVVKQMEAIGGILGGRVQLEWEYRDQAEYEKNVKYRVVCQQAGLTKNTNWTDEGPGAGAHSPLSADGTNYYPIAGGAPDSQLTWGFLDAFRMKVLRNGALLSALGQEMGVPVLTVIASEETTNSLRLSIQGDLRWGAPSKLLAPFGVLGSLKGYYLLSDPYPRRFNWNATTGDFEEVPKFINNGLAVKGEEEDVNPAWETASYEESQIWDPTLYNQLIPAPFTSAGAGVTFDPVNYTGQYSLKNILDRDCNPDGNIVFHQAILADGDEPQYTMRGVSYLHLRCDPALNPAACNTPQS